MATMTPTRSTPEDLLRITDRPMPELVDGQLVERGTGQKADAVGARACGIIGNYAAAGHEGVLHGPQFGYRIFPDDPDKVRIPYASYTRTEHVTPEQAREDHGRFRPDLVVEVIFPDTPEGYTSSKVDDFLRAQVPWIWVVDPDARTVRTYRDGVQEPVVRPGDTLRGGDILPGFECPVAKLFE